MYRKKNGISQEQLAEILDISVAAVSNLERGINFPSMENFILIADTLKVSADELLGDVLKYSAPPQTNELSQMLKDVSPQKRRQIVDIIEILLKNDN